ncbi:MAG: hypothetical protein ACJ74Q_15920 [Pyrinomonadaceae bacterium]
MRATVNKNNDSARGRRRFSVLTIILSAAVGVALAWGEHGALGEGGSPEFGPRQMAEARKEAEAKIPRLAPDTEAKLEAANFPELPPVSTAVDPSLDRAGISGTRPSFAAGLFPGGGLRQAAPQLPAQPPVPDLAARVAAWREEYRAALGASPQRQRPPRTKIYLLSELSPTGRVRIKGTQYVYFRSSADKTEFSVPVGTQFFDAELIDVGPDGPVFRLKNGTTRTVKYQACNDAAAQSMTPTAEPAAEESAKSAPKE